ncbi:MAG: hypothetical protein J6C98_00805 [Oscillospiraceae bacterium]|nr:hypothetical protein [Oscillospiraceae bacterium]
MITFQQALWRKNKHRKFHSFFIHIPQPLWKSFEVQQCNVTFLSVNNKVTKEIGLKGAELIAPAIKAAPYKKTPVRTEKVWSTLTGKTCNSPRFTDGGGFALPALPVLSRLLRRFWRGGTYKHLIITDKS